MAFYLGLFSVKSYLQGTNCIAYRRANCHSPLRLLMLIFRKPLCWRELVARAYY